MMNNSDLIEQIEVEVVRYLHHVERVYMQSGIMDSIRRAIAALSPVLLEEVERGKRLALRQYRHNNSEGFVFGYDKELMDVFIERLEREKQQADQRIEELEAKLEAATKALDVARYNLDQLAYYDGGNTYAAEACKRAAAALKSIKEE